MNSREKPPASAKKRKPYRRPVLETYGNIRDLTKVAGGAVGANDGAPMGNKTGL